MSDVVEILLVRHGRTAWNAARRFLGTTDLPLDEVGLAQADALAAEPALRARAALYTSPLLRARQTAAPLGGEAVVVPDLREMAQGELEGLDFPDAFARFPDFFASWALDPTGKAPPGGEALDVTRDRAMAALERLARAHAPGERVVVVTHQMVIASVSATLAGEGLQAFRAWGVDHVAWRTVRARHGTLERTRPA